MFRALAAADLNGDGCDDLLASAAGVTRLDSGLTAVYRGTPVGLDTLPVWSNARRAMDNDGLGTAGDLADVDGDGHLDLVLTAPLARHRGCIYTFSWQPEVQTLPADPSSSACGDSTQDTGNLGAFAAAGDFDADGHVDAIMVELAVDRSALWTARGGPDGLDETGVTRISAGGVAPRVSRLSSGDIDGDGFADVIVERLEGGTTWLRGSPTGLVQQR